MLRALKNFGIAFLISAVIVGISAAVIFNSVEDVLTGSFSKNDNDLSEILKSQDEDTPGGSVSESGNEFSGLGGSSFTVLAVMTDYRPDTYDYYSDDTKYSSNDEKKGIFSGGLKRTGAEKICLLKCSKETGKYIVVPISPITNVTTEGGYSKLYDIYTDYGIEYMKAKIEAMTGLAIDRYAVINCTNMTSFVSVLGAVWCTVPCDIYTDGKEYVSPQFATAAKVKDPKSSYTSFLEACDDYIGPSSMGLLLFKDYSNGIEDEMTICAEYMKGICANLAKFPSESLASYWDNIAATMRETNIDSAFIAENIELIGAYNDKAVSRVNIAGLFKPSGSDGEPVFDVDISRTVEALSLYR